jgi:transposase-like protein
MWWIVSQKSGTSAKYLKDSMGFGSYKTAWAWLHKIRRVMIRPHRDRLHGAVEVDETYIGSEEEGSKGTKIVKKSLVVVAVEEVEGRVGRVRFRCISDASEKELLPFIKDNIEAGSVVITDGWKGYSSVGRIGYNHLVRNISESDNEAVDLLPNVHLIVSPLKRWLLGTYQGAVSSDHLQYYLDEYAFRFNRRLSTHRGKLFYRLMQLAVTTEAIPLKNIFAKKTQDVVVTWAKGIPTLNTRNFRF